MMMRRRTIALRIALASLLLALPASLRAAEPEKIASAGFSLRLDPSGPSAEVSFALALSEVSSYPVTITAIAGGTEEVLWTGTLAEGVYRLRAPLTKIRSGPVRVVLKTKVVNRTERGSDSYLIYLKADGSL